MEPTIMKQLNFKKIFLNLLWPLLPFTAQAQENNTLYSILSKDSILVSSPSVQNQEEDIVTQMPNRHHKYDKRVHRYRRAWESFDPHPHQITVRRWNGPVILGHRLGLWKKRPMGNRSSFGLHPPLLIQTFQDDHDLETELYPVEYLAGQRLLARTADYRNLFQHRIQR